MPLFQSSFIKSGDDIFDSIKSTTLMPTLKVHIHKATALPLKNKGNKKIFVVTAITPGDHAERTLVVSNENPEFDSVHTFFIGIKKLQKPQSKFQIEFTVWNKGDYFDDCLGKGKILVDDLKLNEENKLTVKLDSGGKLMVTITPENWEDEETLIV